MSEHFCKDCKHSYSGGNTCIHTGATHTTGIECPSFRAKEKEVEMYPETDHESIRFSGHPEGVLGVKDTEPVAKEVAEVLAETVIRTFDSGATRDTAQGKLDYLKALSPIVLRRYVQYLDKHRLQPDGSYRDFDNWKKGIPQEAYISGGGRHFFDVWLLTEGYAAEDNHGPVNLEDALCAQLFNLMGRLHEILKTKVDRTAPIEGGY